MKEKIYHFASPIDFGSGNFKDGDIVDIQIFRQGKRNHPKFGSVKITDDLQDDIVNNFKERSLRQEIPVDINHEPNKEAVAWYKDVYRDGKTTRARIELTAVGAEKLNNKAFKYFSPEFRPQRTDTEKGVTHTNILTGGGLTNIPYFKDMDKVIASDPMPKGTGADENTYFIFSNNENMDALKEMLEGCKTKKTMSFNEKFDLKMLFNEAEAEVKEEVKAEVDENLAKPEVEVKEEEKKEEKKEEEKKEEEKKDGEGEKVTASDPTQSLAFKEMEVKVQAMEANERKREFSDKFDELQKGDTGFLPKDKNDVVEFCESIGKENANKFFDIVKNVKNLQAFSDNMEGGQEKKGDLNFSDPMDFKKRAKKMAEKEGITEREATLKLAEMMDKKD